MGPRCSLRLQRCYYVQPLTRSSRDDGPRSPELEGMGLANDGGPGARAIAVGPPPLSVGACPAVTAGSHGEVLPLVELVASREDLEMLKFAVGEVVGEVGLLASAQLRASQNHALGAGPRRGLYYDFIVIEAAGSLAASHMTASDASTRFDDLSGHVRVTMDSMCFMVLRRLSLVGVNVPRGALDDAITTAVRAFNKRVRP